MMHILCSDFIDQTLVLRFIDRFDDLYDDQAWIQ